MKLTIEIPNEWFDQMVREEFTNYPSKVDELCAIIQHSVAIPNKVGHWIEVRESAGIYRYKCDKCNLYFREKTEFCPNCGNHKEIER